MRVDIRGALMNWSDSEWLGCVKDDSGQMMTPREVKAAFLDQLAKGNRYIPMGGACDNFSPTEGCLGHEDRNL